MIFLILLVLAGLMGAFYRLGSSASNVAAYHNVEASRARVGAAWIRSR